MFNLTKRSMDHF